MLVVDEEYQLVKHELRQEIQRHMWRKGWKKADLAAAAGLYPSDLSNFMNGNGTRTFPLEALDAITEALGLEAGHFYPLYFGECYNKGKLIRHRCEEFLYRCALLRKDAFVQRLMDALLSESKSNLQTIFAVAKRLFDEKHPNEALPLVDAVIENDHNRFSERLATCYFYRFFIVRNHGMEQGYHALVKMLEYLAYMPADVQMEAYLRIITFYHAREEWKFVLQYAKELEKIAIDERYLGESLLYQSAALQEMGNYTEAMRITDQYAEINQYYSGIAAGNRLFISVNSGKIDYIDELISHLEQRGIVYQGIPKILDALIRANKWDQVENLLSLHKDEIKKLEQIENPFIARLLLDFRISYAKYLFHVNLFGLGLEEILHAIYLADHLGNMERFRESLRLFWKYHEHTSPSQKAKLDHILGRNDEYEKILE